MAHIEVKDADGTVLHTYEIILDGSFLTNAQDLMFDEARRNAVEDGLVDEDAAASLTCTVVDAPGL